MCGAQLTHNTCWGARHVVTYSPGGGARAPQQLRCRVWGGRLWLEHLPNKSLDLFPLCLFQIRGLVTT